MQDQEIAEPKVFIQWLQEKKVYLQSLSKEPKEETLQMDYYLKLVSLEDFQLKLQKIQDK
ncbi:hypothetical protein H0H92_002581 [Tricholoma furcatifolium]|nr:hypothetical protein H0H92_002581 [Tricholoma furcatifolium]